MHQYQQQNQKIMFKKNEQKKPSPLPLMGTICNAQRELDSFRPISVNQILEDIRMGIYRRQVEKIRLHRLVKDYDLAQQYVQTLPIIYPGAECPDVDKDTASKLNGLAVVRMSYFDVHEALEAMEHLRVWKFVKAFYTNVFGQVIIYIWLGRDYADVNELMQRRNDALEAMNAALRNVQFECHQRMLRGVMAAYDPECFCRPDSELVPFSIFFNF